jgi:hypothetical protein
MRLTEDKMRCDRCYRVVPIGFQTKGICDFCKKDLNVKICEGCGELFHHRYLTEENDYKCPVCLKAKEDEKIVEGVMAEFAKEKESGQPSITEAKAFARGVNDALIQDGRLSSGETYREPALNEAYDRGANAAEAWYRGMEPPTQPEEFILDPEIRDVIDGLRNAPPQNLPNLDAAQERIDNLVHHAKGEEAADVNNGGFEDQVEFLLQYGITREDILKALKGE